MPRAGDGEEISRRERRLRRQVARELHREGRRRERAARGGGSCAVLALAGGAGLAAAAAAPWLGWGR